MKSKTIINERRKVWRVIVSSIRGAFPFSKKSELVAFNKFAGKFSWQFPGINKSDTDFFLFLERFFARFGNSHSKLNKYPTKKFYLPKGYQVAQNGDNFYLIRKGNFLGKIILIDGLSPRALLRYHYSRVTGPTRHFRISQSLKFILSSYIKQPAHILINTKIGNKLITVTRHRAGKNQKNIKPITIYKYKNDVIYIRIISWRKEVINNNQIEEAINKVARLRGRAIIIDLRGNGGGSQPRAACFAGHFFSTTVPVGISERRLSENSLKTKKSFYYFTRRHPFLNLPVIILINSQCMSASELFISGMLDNQRVMLIGESTAGGSGSPRMFSTTYGRKKVSYQISTWRFYRRTGQPIEGMGIKPHIIVKPKLEDIKSGKDVVLERALKEAKKLAKI